MTFHDKKNLATKTASFTFIYIYIIYQLQYTKSSYCGWFSDEPTVAMEDDARMHCARNVSLKPGFNLALLDGHFCSLLERTAVNAAPKKTETSANNSKNFLEWMTAVKQQINYLHCLHAWRTPCWSHRHACSPKMLCQDSSSIHPLAPTLNMTKSSPKFGDMTLTPPDPSCLNVGSYPPGATPFDPVSHCDSVWSAAHARACQN